MQVLLFLLLVLRFKDTCGSDGMLTAYGSAEMTEIKNAFLKKVPSAFHLNLRPFHLVISTSDSDCFMRLGQWEFLCTTIMEEVRKSKQIVERVFPIAKENSPLNDYLVYILLAFVILAICVLSMCVFLIFKKKSASKTAMHELDEMATTSAV